MRVTGERSAVLPRRHPSRMCFHFQFQLFTGVAIIVALVTNDIIYIGVTLNSIREQCGHSLKSALTHMWVHDMRDEPLLPSTGHFVRVIQEYAGLGGDVNHIRQEVEAQVARSNNTGYVCGMLFFSRRVTFLLNGDWICSRKLLTCF